MTVEEIRQALLDAQKHEMTSVADVKASLLPTLQTISRKTGDQKDLEFKHVVFHGGTTAELKAEHDRLTNFYSKDELDPIYNTLRLDGSFEEYNRHTGLFSGAVIIRFEKNKYSSKFEPFYIIELDDPLDGTTYISALNEAKKTPILRKTRISFPETNNLAVDWLKTSFRPTSRSLRNVIYRVKAIDGDRDVKKYEKMLHYLHTYEELPFKLTADGRKELDPNNHYIRIEETDDDDKPIVHRSYLEHSFNLSTDAVRSAFKAYCKINNDDLNAKLERDGFMSVRIACDFYLPNFVLPTRHATWFSPQDHSDRYTWDDVRKYILDNTDLEEKDLPVDEPESDEFIAETVKFKRDGTLWALCKVYNMHDSAELDVVPMTWFDTGKEPTGGLKSRNSALMYQPKASPVVIQDGTNDIFEFTWLFGDFKRAINNDKNWGRVVPMKPRKLPNGLSFDEIEYDM